MTKQSKINNISFLPSLAYELDVIFHLGWRNFILRYKGSALGVLWSLIMPLSQLLIFSFVFERVIRLDIKAYPLFLFTGILPWNWFNSCISSAGWLFINNRDLMRKPNLLPANLVIADTITNLVSFAFLLPLLFFLIIIFQRDFPIFILIIPIILLIQAILIVGLGLIISISNVIFPDLQHMIKIILMFLFYLTPIFYRADMADKKYEILFTVNPLASLINCYRAIFFYNDFPDIFTLIYPTIFGIVILLIGIYFYKKYLYKIYDLL